MSLQYGNNVIIFDEWKSFYCYMYCGNNSHIGLSAKTLLSCYFPTASTLIKPVISCK